MKRDDVRREIADLMGYAVKRKPRKREFAARVQIAALSALATVCLLAAATGGVYFFWAHSRPSPPPIAESKHIIRPAVLAELTTYHRMDESLLPRGQITYPQSDTRTERDFPIEAFTDNIPPQRGHVWLVVEIPSVGLCWPKCHITETNCRFRCNIHEGGSSRHFTVAMYAVNQPLHAQILDWFEVEFRSGNHGGMVLLPEKYKLDSVRLSLVDGAKT